MPKTNTQENDIEFKNHLAEGYQLTEDPNKYIIIRRRLTRVARHIVYFMPQTVDTEIVKVKSPLLFAEVAYILAEASNVDGDIPKEIEWYLKGLISYCNIVLELDNTSKLYSANIKNLTKSIMFGFGRILILDEREADRQLSLLDPAQRNQVFDDLLTKVKNNHAQLPDRAAQLTTTNSTVIEAVAQRTDSHQFFTPRPVQAPPPPIFPIDYSDTSAEEAHVMRGARNNFLRSQFMSHLASGYRHAENPREYSNTHRKLTPVARKINASRPFNFFTTFLPRIKIERPLLYAELSFVLSEEEFSYKNIQNQIGWILQAVIVLCKVIDDTQLPSSSDAFKTIQRATCFGLTKILTLDEAETKRQLLLLQHEQNSVFIQEMAYLSKKLRLDTPAQCPTNATTAMPQPSNSQQFFKPVQEPKRDANTEEKPYRFDPYQIAQTKIPVNAPGISP